MDLNDTSGLAGQRIRNPNLTESQQRDLEARAVREGDDRRFVGRLACVQAAIGIIGAIWAMATLPPSWSRHVAGVLLVGVEVVLFLHFWPDARQSRSDDTAA